MCDLRLLGDGEGRPSSARALIVGESEAIAVDRDEVLLFEDWRLRPDGTAIAPGIDPRDAVPVYTVNGQRTLDIPVRARERLRLRFINGFQRNVIAVKIEKMDVQVMALDGQPSEPFLARNGALVLAPGGRADAFIDATMAPGGVSSILLHDGTEARPIARLVGSKEPPVRNAPLPAAPPLPSNGLPDRLDLKSALRFDLPLNGAQAGWIAPATFTASAAPAFKVKAGRVVVLALTNRADRATVFHLHGHHFRLLDRLDDGWKPFWLDTLAVEPGQTQRVAFAADTAGRWLMEAMATDWAAPRLLRSVTSWSEAQASVLDAEFVIEAAEYRRQRFRKVFGDQAGSGLARRLAVHPNPDAGGFERGDALRQHACDHSGQHVAGAGGGQPGRRVGGNGRAPVR